ncbi:MAG: hypothetical protein AAGB24_15025 [Bacteroidota bacterium]
MLKKWIQHIVEGSNYYGLEVYERNGKAQWSLLKLEQKRGELHIRSEKTTANLKALPALIDIKHPLFLTINTAQVLKKEIFEEARGNHELSVVNAFPNLELDNFYYQILNANENSIVAISKKDYVDWYVDQLHKIGLKPFSIVLGVAQIHTIGQFFNGSIPASNFNVTFKDGTLQQFETRDTDTTVNEPLEINGMRINSAHVLPFCHILAHLQQTEQVSNLADKNRTHQLAFKNQRAFHFGLKAALSFFFLLLLGNFLVYHHYQNKNETLVATLVSHENQSTAFQQLQKRVAAKEEKLVKLSNSKSSKTTYYFDEVGKGLPHSIWLSDMQYQPLLSPVQLKKPIATTKNNLQISGITNDKIAFTVWSDNLEMQDWASRVEILDYEYISNASANFTINIVLNESK